MDSAAELLPKDIQETINKYMPFLLELRRRLFFSVCLFIITSVVGFIYADRIIELAIKFFGIKGVNIVFTNPFQFINLSFTAAALVGLIVLLPMLIFQLVSFLKPALSQKEYRLLLSLLPISILLFVAGAGFGVFVMRYIVLAFYEQSLKLNIGNYLDISSLISQILTTAGLMGLAFQFPVVFTALLRLKVIKHRTLEKRRLWIYAGAAMFAALLPPADIPSTIIYFIILVLLFEITLLLNRWLSKTHLL